MATGEHYLKVLRGVAVAALGSLVLVSLSGANARADQCDAALDQMNRAVATYNAQRDARLAAFGLTAAYPPFEKSCQFVAFLQWRLPFAQQINASRNAAVAACSNYQDIGNGELPTTVLAAIQADISKYTPLCQQYTAAQSAPQPVAGNPYANQSASCSTITGPGMSGAPTNCPPNEPHPVTTVAPQTQTATVPPAAQPQVSPPSVAPTLPQILVPSVTQIVPQIFAPQLQPAPDPEAQARAAFDKGQAAFNAHDCATALQYFNQAVSLTVSYGSTYGGWRDRAQACAQPTALAPQQPTVQMPTVQAPAPTVQAPIVQAPTPAVQTPTLQTADPEAAALAAFNQGKALYDAHNCAAALPYFNQAFSLTRNLSYAATYSGWADRAKACA